jgi:glc operon protein GlcG
MTAPRLALCLLAAVAALALPGSAAAQLLDSKVVSLEAAKAVAAASEAFARGRGWHVAVAVVDIAGGPIVLLRMDEVQHASADLALGKARTSARFKRPTKALADAVAQGRAGFLGIDGVVPLDGGVPLVVDGKVIGAVGVSGMTGEQDAEVARAGAGALRP